MEHHSRETELGFKLSLAQLPTFDAEGQQRLPHDVTATTAHIEARQVSLLLVRAR